MSRLTVNWIIILCVLGVAVANPLYRYMQLKQPIVTLGLDLKGGVEVLLKAVPDENQPAPGLGGETVPAGTVTPEQMQGAIAVVRNRVDPQGTKEMFISTVGSDRILLQVPGEKNPDNVIKTIGTMALLEFVDTGDQSFEEGTNFNVEGTTRRSDEYSKYETLLTGKDLKRADPDMSSGRPTIAFEFKADAAQTFGEFTNNHVGRYLTILLDGVVLTSPVIESPIWGGHGIIQGSMTMEEVNRIVRQLNAGALPVPLTILSASIVGPTLGQESIDKSFIAGVVGFAVVLLFMMLFYRLAGVVATVALSLYVITVIGILSLIGASLTLPGIAGLLLSIGMAVDANIIIFERLKEEIRWGKTLGAAIEAAFARAWVAILDGQLTTLIAAAVLYFFGSGPIKGFAVTLFVGNIIALYSGVFVTRTLLNTVTRFAKNPKLYAQHTEALEVPGQRLREGHYIRFVEKTGLWVTISLLILVIGVGFMFKNYAEQRSAGNPKAAPFNLGIDYTGGETIMLRTKQEMPEDGQAVTAIVKKYSDGEPTVQVNSEDRHLVSIRMRVKDVQETDVGSIAEGLTELKEEIGNAFGGYVGEGTGQNPIVLEQNYVGPTVGAELIRAAIWALVLGAFLIMIYIVLRFGSWAYSFAAIVALFHDVLIALGFSAILGLEINSSFIAVILTIIGFSINDTIIIFDRVRENLRHLGTSAPLSQLCNLSLTQTLTRSIYTSLTVVVMTVALLLFGGENITDFMLAMLVGLLAGTYSSIYIAVPVMLALSKRMTPSTAAAAAATPAGGAVVGPPLGDGSETSSIAEQLEAARERRERKGGAPRQRRR